MVVRCETHNAWEDNPDRKAGGGICLGCHHAFRSRREIRLTWKRKIQNVYLFSGGKSFWKSEYGVIAYSGRVLLLSSTWMRRCPHCGRSFE